MNITDVGHLINDTDKGQDKMLLPAEREHIEVLKLSRQYKDVFFNHTKTLGLAKPDVIARATEHIQDMIFY